MKLTKGMKKALSLLLSAAMVVTGVNVTANTASAEETGYTITFKATTSTDTETKDADGHLNNDDAKTTGIGIKETYAGDGWGKAIGTYAFFSDEDVEVIKAYKNPVLEIVSVTEGKAAYLYDMGSKTDWGNTLNGTELKNGEKVELKSKGGIEEKIGFFAESGAVVEAKIYDDNTADASTEPSVEPSADASTEPTTEPTTEPGTAYLMYCPYGWGSTYANWNPVSGGGHGKDTVITGNGTYTVSLNKEDFPAESVGEASGAQVFCVDMLGLAASKTMDTTRAMISDVKIKIDGKDFKADQSKMYFGRIESQNTNLRLEICNSEGYKEGDFNTPDEFDNDNFKFEESLSVTFTLSGIVEGQETPEDAYGEDRTPGIPGVEPVVPTKTPVETPAASAPTTTKAPAKTPTASAIATKSTITTPVAVGTSKITPKQKTVVVAPNKTVKVGFTATAAKPATKAAVVTATTASKKVATAKVSGKKVVIKAPKKAVKGSSTTVTLKSTNGDKKVSAKIKVYVRNSAKKVKAAKKAITVKKGKTTKLVIKASKVQNKKKAFADTITVKGKIVKLTDVKFAKGKATLTLKGVKKAKKKAVTIKVGKKSVKVKATVK